MLINKTRANNSRLLWLTYMLDFYHLEEYSSIDQNSKQTGEVDIE